LLGVSFFPKQFRKLINIYQLDGFIAKNLKLIPTGRKVSESSRCKLNPPITNGP